MTRRSIFPLLAVICCASVALGAGALLLSGVMPDTQAAPGQSGSDVIMMRCSTGPTGFTVKVYQRSTSAPSKTSDDCAEALSKVLRSGFSIRETGYNQDGDVMVLTLVR